MEGATRWLSRCAGYASIARAARSAIAIVFLRSYKLLMPYLLRRTITLAWLVSAACSDGSTTQDKPALHGAADASTARREPPGYEPDSIIPEDYTAQVMKE